VDLSQRPPAESSKEVQQLLRSDPGVLNDAMKSALWQISNMKRYDYEVTNALLVHGDVTSLLAMDLPTSSL